MLLVESKVEIARIEVQQRFCESCAFLIKKELQQVGELRNIRLYPKASLITFNFNSANKLSRVLNTLSEIGYSEKGERLNDKCQIFCSC